MHKAVMCSKNILTLPHEEGICSFTSEAAKAPRGSELIQGHMVYKMAEPGLNFKLYIKKD